MRQALVLAGLVVGCGDAHDGSSGTSGAGAGTGSSGPEITGSGGEPATTSGEPQGTTTAEVTGSGTTGTSGGEDPGTTGADTTGAPLPAFDDLPWLTGEDIGYGVAYKDSQDPNARNVFIGYAGYPFPLDAAQSWATALYHARLRELGVRHVYAVQGPATVMYSDYEIGNTSIVAKLASQAADGFVLIAAHSSGSYVAHELLGQLEGGLDPGGVTAGRVVYFNLDGGTAGLYTEAVDRLRRGYYVSVRDASSDTNAPNLDAMQYLGGQWPDKGGYLEIDGSGSGCNAGAAWCLHMRVISSLPHDPWDSSVVDYYDFVDRPVVTSYIDLVADEAGLQP